MSPPSTEHAVTYGIATAPQQVSYQDVLRVWKEAPAMLAKIAAVGTVSEGRLDFGIGVGSRPSPPEPRREYPAHGLPYLDFPDAVKSLAETCTIIRRLWTEDQPFDFDGSTS